MIVIKMTPDQAYRRVIIPLGLFFGLGGAIGAVMFMFSLVPITGPLPFVRSPELNRLIFSLMSLFCLAFGLGLVLRQRVAWIGFLAYIGVGITLKWIGLFDPMWSIGGLVEHQRFLLVMLGTLFDFTFLTVIYYFGKRAFERRATSIRTNFP